MKLAKKIIGWTRCVIVSYRYSGYHGSYFVNDFELGGHSWVVEQSLN